MTPVIFSYNFVGTYSNRNEVQRLTNKLNISVNIKCFDFMKTNKKISTTGK